MSGDPTEWRIMKSIKDLYILNKAFEPTLRDLTDQTTPRNVIERTHAEDAQRNMFAASQKLQ